MAFSSYLIKSLDPKLTKGRIVFICDPLSHRQPSLTFDAIFCQLSDTIIEIVHGAQRENHKKARNDNHFKQSSIEFF